LIVSILRKMLTVWQSLLNGTQFVEARLPLNQSVIHSVY